MLSAQPFSALIEVAPLLFNLDFERNARVLGMYVTTINELTCTGLDYYISIGGNISTLADQPPKWRGPAVVPQEVYNSIDKMNECAGNMTCFLSIGWCTSLMYKGPFHSNKTVIADCVEYMRALKRLDVFEASIDAFRKSLESAVTNLDKACRTGPSDFKRWRNF